VSRRKPKRRRITGDMLKGGGMVAWHKDFASNDFRGMPNCNP
jgi:hypothetical protein